MKKSLCKLNLPQPLCENWNEKELEKKEMQPQANNAQYNTQGWDMKGGGGVKWGDSGRGGGGRLLCANLYMSRVKWYDNTYTFQLLLKKGFYLQ